MFPSLETSFNIGEEVSAARNQHRGPKHVRKARPKLSVYRSRKRENKTSEKLAGSVDLGDRNRDKISQDRNMSGNRRKIWENYTLGV